jgi:hypothetical protein
MLELSRYLRKKARAPLIGEESKQPISIDPGQATEAEKRGKGTHKPTTVTSSFLTSDFSSGLIRAGYQSNMYLLDEGATEARKETRSALNKLDGST